MWSTICLIASLPFASSAMAMALSPQQPSGQSTAGRAPAPVTMNAQQDRQNMLDQLKIQASLMRRGPSGMNPKAPDYQNTDESKANPWPTLPEMMVTKNRQSVTTPELWWKIRRPEIVEYFDAEIYGRVAKDVPQVSWVTTPPKAYGRGRARSLA